MAGRWPGRRYPSVALRLALHEFALAIALLYRRGFFLFFR